MIDSTTPLRLRPSSAGKWINCPGSVKAEHGLPDGDTTHMDTGTVAHWIAAKLLRGGGELPPLGSEFEVDNGEVLPVLFDSNLPVVVFDQEMLDNVLKYSNYLLFGHYDMAKLIVERQLEIDEGFAGTPDLIYIDGNTLEVHDLKYGYNPVQAAHNWQLMIYAYAADIEYIAENGREFTHFKLVIHQPRLGRVDEVTYSRDEIQAFWDVILTRVVDIDNGAETRNAGEWCTKHYCKARATCAVFQDYALEDLPEIKEELNNADIGRKLSKIAAIRDWCDRIEQEAYSLVVEKGQRINGFKVVAGKRGGRAWISESDAEKMLKSMRLKNDVMYSQKLISPTQAEGLYKSEILGERQWDRLNELITQAEGRPLLVPESDKRHEIEIVTDLDLLEDV